MSRRLDRATEKRHTYDIADYGLTQETIDDAFVRYRDFLSGHSRRASLLRRSVGGDLAGRFSSRVQTATSRRGW